jgi:hypothetical protein
LIFNNFFYINGAKKVGPNVMVELLWQTWASNTPELPGGTTAKASVDESEARSQRTDWCVVCDEW